ncbi:MAG: hypothetical protein QXY18_06225 [Nitrososphaerota archaeon]|nr:hypothetical protein [Candidatus Aenigmarchaeota archaeon]
MNEKQIEQEIQRNINYDFDRISLRYLLYDYPLKVYKKQIIKNKKFSKEEIKFATKFVNNFFHDFFNKKTDIFSYYKEDIKINIKQIRDRKNIIAISILSDLNENDNPSIYLNTLYHDFIIENLKQILLHQTMPFCIYLNNFQKKYFPKKLLKDKVLYDAVLYETILNHSWLQKFSKRIYKIREKLIDYLCFIFDKNYYNFFIRINGFKNYKYNKKISKSDFEKDFKKDMLNFSKILYEEKRKIIKSFKKEYFSKKDF